MGRMTAKLNSVRETRKGTQPRSSLWQYGLALGLLALAWLARQLLDPLLGTNLPYITFFIALALTRWLTDLGPSLLSLVAGLAAARLLFSGSTHVLPVPSGLEPYAYNLGIGLVTTSLVVFGEAMRRSRRRAERVAR